MYKNKVIPYLMVRNGKEALEFYKKVFSATIGEVMYADKIPGQENNENAKKTIIHAPLTINGNTIFLADANTNSNSEENLTVFGNNIALCLLYGNKEKQKTTYDLLKANSSKIIMELMDTFWGDTFGVIEDKYGITWQLTYNEKYNS